jgi:hypothetical protein
LIAESDHDRERHGKVIGIALLQAERAGVEPQRVLEEPRSENGRGAHDRNCGRGGKDRARCDDARGRRRYWGMLMQLNDADVEF